MKHIVCMHMWTEKTHFVWILNTIGFTFVQPRWENRSKEMSYFLVNVLPKAHLYVRSKCSTYGKNLHAKSKSIYIYILYKSIYIYICMYIYSYGKYLWPSKITGVNCMRAYSTNWEPKEPILRTKTIPGPKSTELKNQLSTVQVSFNWYETCPLKLILLIKSNRDYSTRKSSVYCIKLSEHDIIKICVFYKAPVSSIWHTFLSNLRRNFLYSLHRNTQYIHVKSQY